MEYRKVNGQSYNIHFVKTNKFKKIKIRINFKEPIEKEKIAYRNMLSLILLEATKNFPTRRLLDIECERLYNISVGASTSQSGNYQLLRFDSTILNEKYTEEGATEESFQFFLDFIFKPNIENNRFDIQTFNNAKNILKEDIESFSDNPGRYAFSKLYEKMCPDSVLRYRSTGYMEDLEKITPENLYDYYKELLRTNIIDIFVVGDIDFNYVEKLINNNFGINTLKNFKQEHFLQPTKPRLIPQVVKETKEINQSIVILAYKLKDITPFEREYVLALYNSILGGGPDSKLFKEVREKNSLCYSISSSHSGIASLQYISAGIDGKTFDKTVKLIKREVKNIEKGNFTLEELNQAKITYLSSLKEIEDSVNGIINIYEAHEYLNYNLLEERAQNIEKVTKEDIINVSKKIKLDTIFLLKGDRHEEDGN